MPGGVFVVKTSAFRYCYRMQDRTIFYLFIHCKQHFWSLWRVVRRFLWSLSLWILFEGSACVLSVLSLFRGSAGMHSVCLIPVGSCRHTLLDGLSRCSVARASLFEYYFSIKKKGSLFYFPNCSSTTASILHDVNAWINSPLHSVCGYTCVYVWVYACIYFLYNSALYIVCVGVIGCRVGCTHALCICSVALRGAILYNRLIFW